MKKNELRKLGDDVDPDYLAFLLSIGDNEVMLNQNAKRKGAEEKAFKDKGK